YSHTFEHIFHTNHEQITRQLITDSSTNINKILQRVSPDFPHQVASVIDHTYENPQVVQMISSQVDADRMDYLQRDAYYTGTNYGKFDLDRVLHVMRPVKRGIAFEISGMQDRKSTRLNSSHVSISYAVFCLKKKSKKTN